MLPLHCSQGFGPSTCCIGTLLGAWSSRELLAHCTEVQDVSCLVKCIIVSLLNIYFVVAPRDQPCQVSCVKFFMNDSP